MRVVSVASLGLPSAIALPSLRALSTRALSCAATASGVLSASTAGAGSSGALREAGVSRVYTPKDFDLTRIMDEIVDVVSESPAVG